MENEIINVWSKDNAKLVKENTRIWTVRWYSEEFPDGLLFDRCFLSETSLKKYCWWFNNKHTKNDLKIFTMSFDEYLKLHVKEIRGMNPLFDIGRVEFILEYEKI